jgi:hypothetical protein
MQTMWEHPFRQNKKLQALNHLQLFQVIGLFGAEDGIRTRDPRLGKAMLYP